MKLALRIDVDTLRGTLIGVPQLVKILAELDVKATFYFSVGPDNMGRHVWRLIRPKFAMKMMRTNANRLYGWRTLLNGTFWPGPMIGEKAADEIREVADAGHEVGIHAWDHHGWQRRTDLDSKREVNGDLIRAYGALKEIVGDRISSSATPAWMTSEEVCRQKLQFPFQFNSDCRGYSAFRPQLSRDEIGQIQIPTTLPTYDEMAGIGNMGASGFFAHIKSLLLSDSMNVYTAHAEVEGMSLAEPFKSFLKDSIASGFEICHLGKIVRDMDTEAPLSTLQRRALKGRDGWLSWQAECPVK